LKILVLFCGGTIVMEETSNGSYATPEPDRAKDILLNLEPRLQDELDALDLEFIDNIDSTNIKPHHWDLMLDAIKNNYDKYDGFVITHGTDTMAYTSSALSHSIHNLGKPIVVTGAQIPANELETDARRNFINAVRVACLDLAGVYVVFDEEIIEGDWATKVSESKLDAFETVNKSLFGEIRTKIRIPEERSYRHNKIPEFNSGFCSDIIVETIVPGYSLSRLQSLLQNGIKGLILRGYGSGNIPDDIASIVCEARSRGILVVVSTQCLEGATEMHTYEVGQQVLDMGALQAHEMSLESIITKMMWVLARAESLEDGERLFREATNRYLSG